MITFNEFLNEKKSPYKEDTLKRYQKKWKNGDTIPFGIEASLKAQGMIPRADGTTKVSPEYQEKSALSPKNDAPESYTDKVDKKLNKEKIDRETPKKDEIKTKQKDFHHKKGKDHRSDDEKWIEGNKKKVKTPFKPEIDKKSQHKPLEGTRKLKKKAYNKKAVQEEFDFISSLEFNEIRNSIILLNL